MERCSNCGAATRPGAKFCTSCGTRLNLDQESTGPADAAWNDASSTQETRVATPSAEEGDITTATDAVTPEPHWEETIQDPGRAREDEAPAATWSTESQWSAEEADSDTEADSQGVPGSEESDWSSKWRSSGTVDEEAADAGGDSDSTFPDHNRWSWSTTSEETAATEDESVTITASTTENETATTAHDQDAGSSWTTSLDDVEIDEVSQESETIIPAPDTASLSEAGESNVPSDASVSVDNRDSAITAGRSVAAPGDEPDPREQASALLEELRVLVWRIGENEPSGERDIDATIDNMRRARGETGDFSDLWQVIEAVRENPRDIDALRDLGMHAHRLQALLESHASLTRALDDAIRTLR